MKAIPRKILIGLALVFIAIQFVRPQKNVSAIPAPANDLLVRYNAPSEVRRILEKACYDCHSNQTRYPWYAEVQPFGWFLADHIKEGKRYLNFSEIGALSNKRQANKIQAIIDEASDRSMPLKSYTLIHPDALLSSAEIKTLSDWAEPLLEKLAPDGL